MVEMNLSYFVRNYYRSLISTCRRNIGIVIACIILFITLFLSIGFIRTQAAAFSNEPRVKQVVSMKIQKGDTLWSIAKEYITQEYDDMNEYIREIKSSNGLVSDTIHEGAYLIVPYYVSVSN